MWIVRDIGIVGVLRVNAKTAGDTCGFCFNNTTKINGTCGSAHALPQPAPLHYPGW